MPHKLPHPFASIEGGGHKKGRLIYREPSFTVELSFGRKGVWVISSDPRSTDLHKCYKVLKWMQSEEVQDYLSKIDRGDLTPCLTKEPY